MVIKLGTVISMNDLLISGSGGHSRAVISAACLSDDWNLIGIIDINFKEEQNILGVPVIGSIEKLNSFSKESTKVFIAIGDNKIRKSIHSDTIIKDFDNISIIHPTAIIDPSAIIGKSNFIGPFANIGPNVLVGSYNLINSYSNIEHETVIGDFNDFAPSSVICGRCKIGNNIFVGANSTIIDNITINNNNKIGAGSVIIKDILVEGKTYVGVPGKAL